MIKNIFDKIKSLFAEEQTQDFSDYFPDYKPWLDYENDL